MIKWQQLCEHKNVNIQKIIAAENTYTHTHTHIERERARERKREREKKRESGRKTRVTTYIAREFPPVCRTFDFWAARFGFLPGTNVITIVHVLAPDGSGSEQVHIAEYDNPDLSPATDISNILSLVSDVISNGWGGLLEVFYVYLCCITNTNICTRTYCIYRISPSSLTVNDQYIHT